MRATVAAVSALAALSSAAPTSNVTKRQNGGQVVGYWGNSGEAKPLSNYCADGAGYDMIVLAFIANYGNGNAPSGQFSNTDSQCVVNADGSSSGCEGLNSDIKTCQAAGKKIILSLGGASAPGTLNGQPDAEGVATSLWNYFGNPAVTDPSSPRPFGDSFVNGFDLDIERSDGQDFYPFLTSKLRELYSADTSNQYVVTAAPQCVIPEANLGATLSGSKLDYIFMQFYNNPLNCDASNLVGGGAGGTFNYDAWVDNLAGGPNADTPFFVGIPGSGRSSAANPQSFVDPSKLGDLYSNVQGKKNFAGFMFWEAAESDTIDTNGCTFAQALRRTLDTGSSC